MQGRAFGALIAAWMAWPLPSMAQPASATSVEALAADGPIAVRTIDFPDLRDAARGDRPVPMKLHLPAGESPAPLVILSHGAGGSRDANFAQAHHLASHGYAVLALEHPGSGTERLLAGGRFMANLAAMTRDASEVLGRPRDVSFAIDLATRWQQAGGPSTGAPAGASAGPSAGPIAGARATAAPGPELQGRFDLSRIAVMGHSFGAYTALVACGARPARDWLIPAVPPGHGLVDGLADPRVKACIALSPQGPGAPFFTADSYASLDRPVLGISGSADVPQGGGAPSTRRQAFDLAPAGLPGGQWLVWLANAEHTAFSDPSGSGRRGLPSATRADAQPIARAATLAFLDLQLRGRPDAARWLAEPALRPLLRGRIDAVEVLRK